MSETFRCAFGEAAWLFSCSPDVTCHHRFAVSWSLFGGPPQSRRCTLQVDTDVHSSWPSLWSLHREGEPPGLLVGRVPGPSLRPKPGAHSWSRGRRPRAPSPTVGTWRGLREPERPLTCHVQREGTSQRGASSLTAIQNHSPKGGRGGGLRVTARSRSSGAGCWSRHAGHAERFGLPWVESDARLWLEGFSQQIPSPLS